MMSLFDEEQIMKMHIKGKQREAAEKAEKKAAKKAAKKAEKKIAERLIKKGKMSLEDIAECVPLLSFDELKELEAKVTQLT